MFTRLQRLEDSAAGFGERHRPVSSPAIADRPRVGRRTHLLVAVHLDDSAQAPLQLHRLLDRFVAHLRLFAGFDRRLDAPTATFRASLVTSGWTPWLKAVHCSWASSQYE